MDYSKATAPTCLTRRKTPVVPTSASPKAPPLVVDRKGRHQKQVNGLYGHFHTFAPRLQQTKPTRLKLRPLLDAKKTQTATRPTAGQKQGLTHPLCRLIETAEVGLSALSGVERHTLGSLENFRLKEMIPDPLTCAMGILSREGGTLGRERRAQTDFLVAQLRSYAPRCHGRATPRGLRFGTGLTPISGVRRVGLDQGLIEQRVKKFRLLTIDLTPGRHSQ